MATVSLHHKNPTLPRQKKSMAATARAERDMKNKAIKQAAVATVSIAGVETKSWETFAR